MKCPHCLIEFHDTWINAILPNQNPDTTRLHGVAGTLCPACRKFTFKLLFVKPQTNQWEQGAVIWPKQPARAALPAIVNENFASDYQKRARC